MNDSSHYEGSSDSLVVPALGKQPQNFQLPPRELGDLGCESILLASPADEPLDEGREQARRDEDPVLVNGPDRVAEVVHRDFFGEVSARAGLHGADQDVRTFLRRQHQDTTLRELVADHGDRPQAVPAGEPLGQQDDVGTDSLDRLHDGTRIGGLGDDAEIRL